MNRTDLTVYSDNELSLVVFNNPSLYKLKTNSALKVILSDIYDFTDKQWQVLKSDLKQEVKNSS